MSKSFLHFFYLLTNFHLFSKKNTSKTLHMTKIDAILFDMFIKTRSKLSTQFLRGNSQSRDSTFSICSFCFYFVFVFCIFLQFQKICLEQENLQHLFCRHANEVVCEALSLFSVRSKIPKTVFMTYVCPYLNHSE